MQVGLLVGDLNGVFRTSYGVWVHSAGRIFTALSCTNIAERLSSLCLTEMHDFLDSSTLEIGFNNNQVFLSFCETSNVTDSERLSQPPAKSSHGQSAQICTACRGMSK
jgi:hypothetical protein